MRQSIHGPLALAAFGAALICAPFAAAQLAGQPAGAATIPALTAAERASALKEIKARIRSSYVYPERRAAILESLAASAARGRYDTTDPVIFAERVTEDLQATNKDSHLYLRHQPDWFATAQLPPRPEEDARQLRLETQIARYTNHGLPEMKVLPGNIRYLRIEGFAWVEGETAPAYDDAMRFLRGGDAIIIDLRGNSGGWVQASKYLISHFMDAGALIATFHSPGAAPETYRAVDRLPAGRIRGKPVYVLVDNRSRSAAEMVASTFQQQGLGEVVGARTAGAANVSDDFAVAPGFRLSVSTGRTVQAITNTDWEGVGVTPAVVVDPAQALEVAQVRAIDRLLPAAAEGVPRQQLAWARPALEAAIHPAALSEAELRALAGTYGEASVSFEDGALWLRRPDRPASRLAPMTREGLFQATDNPTLRVRITPDALEVLRIDPAWSTTYRKHPDG